MPRGRPQAAQHLPISSVHRRLLNHNRHCCAAMLHSPAGAHHAALRLLQPQQPERARAVRPGGVPLRPGGRPYNQGKLCQLGSQRTQPSFSCALAGAQIQRLVPQPRIWLRFPPQLPFRTSPVTLPHSNAQGGYFVINGSEKVLIAQVRRCRVGGGQKLACADQCALGSNPCQG